VLIAAVAVLGVAFAIGLWLGCLYMLVERPPGRLTLIGMLHGMVGAAGVAMLLFALQGPPRAVKFGAGGFGTVAAVLLAAALAGGVTILGTHLRKRPISIGLVAMHGMFAIVGYTLLCTYFSMVP
jgi:hypothetical protein